MERYDNLRGMIFSDCLSDQYYRTIYIRNFLSNARESGWLLNLRFQDAAKKFCECNSLICVAMWRSFWWRQNVKKWEYFREVPFPLPRRALVRNAESVLVIRFHNRLFARELRGIAVLHTYRSQLLSCCYYRRKCWHMVVGNQLFYYRMARRTGRSTRFCRVDVSAQTQ